jgi:lysozyme
MRSSKKKKRIRRLVFRTFILLIAGLGAWVFYQQLNLRKKVFIRYPEFGIDIPEQYNIHGIDVSKYQSLIAWDEVKAMRVKDVRLGFAFIKATEGIGNTDPNFHRNWKKAKDNGVIRGAYHFFIASKDGRMQAENFIDKVELSPGDLPPVLDIEQLNGVSAAVMKVEIRKWLDIVENHYQVKPIIYTNVDFYNRCLGNDFDTYPLWLAHYYQPEKPRIKRDWLFWQHSDQGRVNGIAAKVDFNVFNGDSTEFQQVLLK